MFLIDWLNDLKSVLGQFALTAKPVSPRRRRNCNAAFQPSEALEGRVLLSAGALHALHGHTGNNSPTIIQPDSPVTYVVGGAPVVLAPGALITDPGSAYSGSTLNVQLAWQHSTTSTDVLSIVAGNGVTVSSGGVSYNGTQIGSETGGTGGAALVITFNSSANQTGVNAVLEQVAYSNSSASPNFSQRQVAFQFKDGSGATSHQAVQEVNLVSPAVITGLGAPVTYTAGGAPVVIAPAAQVSDANGAYANSSLNVQIAWPSSSTSTGVLSIVAGNGVTVSAGQVLYTGTQIGSVTGGTGGVALVVTFNASASQAGIQAVVDQTAYSNSAAAPKAGETDVVFQLTDGNGASSHSVRQDVQIVPAAAITSLGPPVYYVAGFAPVVISPNALVTDTTNSFASSTLNVQFTRGQSATSTDVLSIIAGNGVTVSAGQVSYNSTVIGAVIGGTAGAALVVTFNASATQAGVQAALDQVAYSNSSATPTPWRLGVVFQFTDGNGSVSQPGRQQVNVLTSPAITQMPSSVTYTAGGSAVLIATGAQVIDTAGAFANSSINVQFTRGQSSTSTDVLSIIAGNGVTVSSGQVLYNSTQIGTVTGGTGGTVLAVTFNASATQAGVQAVLDQIAYSNSIASPNLGERGLVIGFTDGNGAASQLAHQEVQIVSAAAITQVGPPVSYSAGGATVAIAPTALVTDANAAFAGSTLTVQFARAHSSTSTDILSVIAGNGVTVSSGQVLFNGVQIGTVTGGTGGASLSVTFNSSATQAGVQSVLNQIAYSNSSATPKHGDVGLVLQFTDGNGSASRLVFQEVRVG